MYGRSTLRPEPAQCNPHRNPVFSDPTPIPTQTCHPDRSEPTPFHRVRVFANAWARAVEGPWLALNTAYIADTITRSRNRAGEPSPLNPPPLFHRHNLLTTP